MNLAKPDCTGQKFGNLTVLGKSPNRLYAGVKNRKNNSYYPWILQCSCGKIIYLKRGDFDRVDGLHQKSCGCLKGVKKRVGEDITGHRFGQLTAVKPTGERRSKKAIWLFECDCGGFRKMSVSEVRQSLKRGYRLTCKNRGNHPDKYLEYPPTPIFYPKDAGEIIKKYLHLTELEEPNYQNINRYNPAIQDDKKDRLIRAAWIITYRRWQGEDITELHEKRIINKYLRYSSVNVFWKSKIESQGGLLYNASGVKKEIGSTMTDLTLKNYPAIETQGINTLSIVNLPAPKHLKFKRC